MTYPKLERLRRIVSYPVRLVILPFWAVITFFLTDFDDEGDVEFFGRSMKELYNL